MTTSYETSRHSLHGLAELVLAGPRYLAGGSMRLRADDEGIRTWDDPPVRLSHGDLLHGGSRISLDGLTFGEAAAAVGLTAQSLDHVYHDGPHVGSDERIVLDPADVAVLEGALELGDTALRTFAPDTEPVLWPEHFDVAITVGDVNYGVSPGDGHHELPYAYVGPHQARSGAFWNAPFGAVRPVSELGSVDEVVEFYREGARHAGG